MKGNSRLAGQIAHLLAIGTMTARITALTSSAQALVIHLAPCSKSLYVFSRTTSCCPTATHGQIRLRCVTQPDPAQAALLDRLGIVLPKRMRIAEHQLPALAASA